MKKTYFAVTVEENKKLYAYMIDVSEYDNVIYALSNRGIVFANAYQTKKAAMETVSAWNESYKNNGSYAFA